MSTISSAFGPLPMRFTSLMGRVSLPSSMSQPFFTKKVKSPAPIWTCPLEKVWQ